MKKRFPLGWRHLKSYEAELRQRESSAFDDDEWYRFGRNQNIEKQKLPKLGVAQTVPEMRVFNDVEGQFCLNNVRVNGILTEGGDAAYFLLGVLNCRVADFVFRRGSKPKERRPSGSYFEANKQYIAPLPIPKVAAKQKARVAEMARGLEKLHSARRDAIDAIEQRLSSDQMASSPRDPNWLWGDIGDLDHWMKKAPAGLKGREQRIWAKEARDARFRLRLDWVDGMLSYGATMGAVEGEGEITFFVSSRQVVSVYVDEKEAPIVLAQWKHVARDTFVSDDIDAEKLIRWLLHLKSTANSALIAQVAKLNSALDDLELKITSAERELDDCCYELYALTDSERFMVEADTRPRWDARIPMLSS